jgi:hypothetical protein
MHEIHNTNTTTPRTIPTDRGPYTLRPGEKKSFPVGAIGAGVLRTISSERSDVKVNHTSPDAEKAAADALSRVKKKNFYIVHGSGDRTVEEALAAENAPRTRRPSPIRDEFAAAAKKSQKNLQDPADTLEPFKEGDDEPEGNDGAETTDTSKPGRVKLNDDVKLSPISQLISDVEAETVSMRDLRTRAKELLDEDQKGQSKEQILAALKKADKKAS